MPHSASVAQGAPLKAQCPDGRVVVDVLLVVVVVVLGVVVLVDVVQQNPSAAASSCTSPGRHVSRILTEVLKLPSFRGLAQRTAPSAAVPTIKARTVSRATIVDPPSKRPTTL
jgi:hypothetical protein